MLYFLSLRIKCFNSTTLSFISGFRVLALDAITRSQPLTNRLSSCLIVSLAALRSLFLRVASLKWIFAIDTPIRVTDKALSRMYKTNRGLKNLLPSLNTFLKSAGFRRLCSFPIVVAKFLFETLAFNDAIPLSACVFFFSAFSGLLGHLWCACAVGIRVFVGVLN